MLPFQPHTVLLVQESWKAVEARTPEASTLFYDNLFIADPSLVPLFGDNMSEQADKLMQMLRFAVYELNNPDTFLSAFQALGKRHVGYGVQNAHYETVGKALLKALAQSLGDRFTPQVREAWETLYGVMAGIMMSAAKTVPPRRQSDTSDVQGAASPGR
jgi:hemoglobin-like flavoprotein